MLVLATSVWIGGLAAIFVVARVAHATLGAGERVAFFRGLGRAYGLAGGVALTTAWPSINLSRTAPGHKPATSQAGRRRQCIARSQQPQDVPARPAGPLNPP